jgi:hypothetical protein
MKAGAVTCCCCCEDSNPACAAAEWGAALFTFKLASKLLLVAFELKIPERTGPLDDSALPGVRFVIKSSKPAHGPFPEAGLASTYGCLGKTA